MSLFHRIALLSKCAILFIHLHLAELLAYSRVAFLPRFAAPLIARKDAIRLEIRMNEKYSRQGERIARVIARDGIPAARAWARRTARVYRAAVLEREPFAHAGACRRQFIESYLELKRFAADGRLPGSEASDPVMPTPENTQENSVSPA